MTNLLEALEGHGAGLPIAVDEVQPSFEEMVRLAAVYQRFVTEGRKVGLLMAGLAHKILQCERNDTVSFLRRAE